MKRTLFFSVVFLLTICAGIGFARGKGKMSLMQFDTDSDGKISRQEFQNAPHRGNRNSDDIFNRLDTDGDGYITQQEMQNGRGPGQGKGRRPGMGGQW